MLNDQTRSHCCSPSGTVLPFDAVSQLNADHRRIKRLFGRFGTHRSVNDITALVQTICDQLTIYLTIKEEIVYPSLRHASREGQQTPELDESVVEHFSVKIIMETLDGQAPCDPLFMAKVQTLKRHFIRHVDADERRLLPELRLLAIGELSRQIHQRRSQLEHQGLRRGFVGQPVRRT